jgi:hypothetical protein
MLLAAAPIAAAQTAVRQRDTRISLLDRWVTAVDKHVPGEMDAAVADMAKLTPAQRGLLMELAAPFARYLYDGKLALPHKASPPEASVIEALKTRILAGSYAAWLHRAVMFETDVAILAPDLTAEAMRGADTRGVVQAIHSDDGELGARETLNWHWSFARDLLDARDPIASDVFAASWYHAVALYQLNEMLLGELEPHLIKGSQLFPQDARIQFDDACLADAFGSARVQAVLTGADVRGFRPNIPAAGTTRQTAMLQFARAIELDPDFPEARVRLARLYAQDGRNAEALALLATAFKLPMGDETEYVAHLIAGRANGALGHTEDGLSHLKAALELFPTAQTPIIAMSRLYLESGDLERATALAAGLGSESPAEDRNDPWWSYFPGAWLGQGALLDRLRDQVRR